MPIETSFSRRKGRLLVDGRDGRIELGQGGAERSGQRVRGGVQRGRVGSEYSEIQLAVEEGHPLAIRRQMISVRVGLAVNQRAEPKAPEVVRHLGGGIGAAEQRGDARSQVPMPKASGQMGKARQGLEERLHTRIAEAQRGHAMAAERQWVLHKRSNASVVSVQ